MKWNCLDAFNASATLQGTPLRYPLSQFPATRHYPQPLFSNSPPLFHPFLSFYLFFIVYFSAFPFFPPFPPLFRFLFTQRRALRLSTTFLSIDPVRYTWKRLQETGASGGRFVDGPWKRSRGFDSAKLREESTLSLHVARPLSCSSPPQKNVSALLKRKTGKRATPAKNDRLWDRFPRHWDSSTHVFQRLVSRGFPGLILARKCFG